MFFSAFFCSKKTYEKKVDFLRKTMDKPLCKMSIFSTFLELHFSGLKSILFYPEYQKIFLSGFFGSKKKNIRKRALFLDKNHGLIPLQNVDFFDFFKTSLFRSKKRSFLSRTSKNVSFLLSLLKRTDEEKVHFLGKTMD